MNGDVGTQCPCEGELLLRDIHRDDMQSHRLRVLHGDVAEPSDAGDHDPFTRPRPGFPDAFVGGHARAKNGRERGEVGPLGEPADVVG